MDVAFSGKERIRLRLVFDSPPPKFPQSSKYLILIDRNKCKTIQHVEQTIIKKLRFSKRAKFHLSLGEFSLVSSESTEILSNEDCLNIHYLGKEKINLKRKFSQDETHISDVSTIVPSKSRCQSSHVAKQMKTKSKIKGDIPSTGKEMRKQNKKRNTSKINTSSSNTPKKYVVCNGNGVSPVGKKVSEKSESLLQQKGKALKTDSKTNAVKTVTNKDSMLQDSSSSSSSSSESSESSEEDEPKKVVPQANSKPLAVEKKSNVMLVNSATKSSASNPSVKFVNKIQPKQNLSKFSKNDSTQKSKVHIKFDSDSEGGSEVDNCPDIVENAIHSKENAFKSSVPQQTAQLQDWLNSSVTKLAKRHAKNKMEKSQSNIKFIASACNTNKSVVIKNPTEAAVNDAKAKAAELRPRTKYNELDAAAWPPNVNATIAYKLLEMTENYTPEITDYKEAIVQEVFPSNVSPNGVHSIRVKVTWPCNTRRRSGRFEMEMSDEDDQDEAESIIEWQSLISPKIILS